MLNPFEPHVIAALEKAFEDTFEGIAFAQIYTREQQTEPVEPGEDVFCTFIDLPEPMGCRFFAMMKRGHVEECFSAVYTGTSPEDVEEAVLVDFVNELCNTAAGHFATIIAPEKQDMVVGLPYNPTAEELTDCLTPSSTRCVYFFQVEDYAFYASLGPH